MPWIIVAAWTIVTLALLAVWYLLTARAGAAADDEDVEDALLVGDHSHGSYLSATGSWCPR